MNSIWLSLLWKEWREQRWKLAALSVSLVIGGAILGNVFTYDSWSNVAIAIGQSAVFCLASYALLAGAFVGMSVSAGENSNRTMRFTQALPSPMWKAAIARILVGLFTVVVPIVCTMFVVWALTTYFWSDQLRDDFNKLGYSWIQSNFPADITLSAVLGVSSLLLWTSTCGVNRSDEVRAGAVAFLVCAVLWGIWIYTMEEHNEWLLGSIFESLTVGLPGGPAFGYNINYGDVPKNVPLMATIAIISHGLLLTWFVTRYGKSTGKGYIGSKQYITDWFRFRGPAKPFTSQCGAIIWKQVRELGPLALMSAAGVLAVMIFAYVSEDSTSWTHHDWSELLAGLTLVVGGFVTLVSGIGVIYEDYSRGLPNFWRSRPINLHQWFFLKYVAGILVLVVAFVPLILIAAKLKDWNLVPRDVVVIFALVFLTMYSGSLAAYAMVRQPIYAVILTIAAPYVALFLIYPNGPPPWLTNFASAVLTILMFVILFTILAWQAVIRNWGWKQHR